jgi:predicted O-methyltransferase YrrM
MSRETWELVDQYFADQLLEQDEALDQAIENSQQGGLPQIQVAANQGKLIHLFVKMIGAKRILEIGTLGGYSTIWLARALAEDGFITTLELEPHHAKTAMATFQAAGLGDRIRVIEGPAAVSLKSLYEEDSTPYDFIFVDADKPSNPIYFDWALKFSHPGTVIFIDNVVRDGKVADPNSTDAQVRGVLDVVEMISKEPRVETTALQTVGSKGYDGFILARVIS